MQGNLDFDKNHICDSLPLIIKRYDFAGTLSSLVHNSANSRKQTFEIQGPNGRGLEFNEKQTNGNFAIFVGGTVIFIIIFYT